MKKDEPLPKGLIFFKKGDRDRSPFLFVATPCCCNTVCLTPIAYCLITIAL